MCGPHSTAPAGVSVWGRSPTWPHVAPACPPADSKARFTFSRLCWSCFPGTKSKTGVSVCFTFWGRSQQSRGALPSA